MQGDAKVEKPSSAAALVAPSVPNLVQAMPVDPAMIGRTGHGRRAPVSTSRMAGELMLSRRLNDLSRS
jgi:hypothetical protein